jgi:hypothetical protein
MVVSILPKSGNRKEQRFRTTGNRLPLARGKSSKDAIP